MAKTVSFSGSHSTGKTTVSNAIEQLNIPGIHVEKRSASRAAQKTLKISLPDVTKDAITVRMFQEQVLREKLLQEEENNDKGYDVVFYDRSPADLFAYTTQWNARHPNPIWMQNYTNKLLELLPNSDHIIYFPIRKEISFVAEEGRETLETQETSDVLIRQFLYKYAPVNTHTLTTLTVEDRVNEILKLI